MPGPVPLNQQSGMPQMSAAFAGWTLPITLEIVVQAIAAGLVVETLTPVTFNGTIQPLKPQEIRLKPEGQWSWIWLQIHVVNGSLPLKTNDQILYNSKYYKVMAIRDYSLNNYTEYQVIENYGS